MVEWKNINTVLLDLDGTLIDQRFANQVWFNCLPEEYAKKNNFTLAKATAFYKKKSQELSGTLELYCPDYWEKQLGIDILSLKYEFQHLIKLRPYVLEFLKAVRDRNCKTILITNSHPKGLKLKMKHTALDQHLDRVISAHVLGLPKEDFKFWEKLQQIESFNTAKTLFIDDNLVSLKSANKF